MRLLVLSDLHVEEAPFVPVRDDVDVVVLGGDLHNGAPALTWARAAFPRLPIVQIAGNHEFYDGEYHEVLASMRDRACAEGVHFLENDEVVIDGVRFLGCTLWTDFRVFEATGREPARSAADAMASNARRVADFWAIRWRDGDEVRPFAPADSARLHAASRAWLADALARAHPGPTVVVSHHLPSWRSVHPDFARWVTNAAFASDLDDLVGRASLWVHGHTHTSHRYRAGAAQVVCNPRGYPVRALRRMGLQHGKGGAPGAGAQQHTDEGAPESFENPGFDAGLVVEVAEH